MIVTLQNGLGLRERAGRRRGARARRRRRHRPGRDAARPGPRARLSGARAARGPCRPSRAWRPRSARAGSTRRRCRDLRPYVWRKLAVELRASTRSRRCCGVDNGALLDDPRAAQLRGTCRARGGCGRVPPGPRCPATRPRRPLAVARRTAGNRSSMRQDLDAARGHARSTPSERSGGPGGTPPGRAHARECLALRARCASASGRPLAAR